METNFENSRTMLKKTERRDPLVSPSNVCYAEKGKNLFYQFPGPTGTIQNFVEFLLELF